MAAEFEEGLARLADIEDPDEGGVCGDCGEEVGVVRGGGNAEEGWWEGEVGTLSPGRGWGVGAGRVERC